MLSISFAVRLFVSFKFQYYVFDKERFDKWQIETLLSAYKILSAKSDTNWICAFKIIQCQGDDSFNELSWTEFTNQNLTEHTAEHDQYIQNFKFVLKLSDFSLTSFEVYKLCQIILIEAERIMDDKSNNNVQAFEQQPLALYTFVKQYFVQIIGKKTPVPKSMEKLVHCALLSFGWELLFRVSLTYEEFLNYFFAKREDECKDVYSIEILDTFMLEFFNEPLRNYTSIIQINVDQCKGVRQFAEALRKIVVENKAYSNTNEQLFELNEFEFLLKTLDNILYDDKNVKILKHLKENFKTKKIFSKKTLNELLALLDQIIEEYSCTSACNFKWGSWEFKENITKFGQTFFEAFKKYSDKVKYHRNVQLMSFPLKLAEHFLERLYTLTESKSASICEIGTELDFVQTIENVASTEQLGAIRRKTFPLRINSKFFKFLFSLAFRLSLQIEQSELAAKYLKAFAFAFVCRGKVMDHLKNLFEFKINISHEMVKINMPNWKFPDYLQTENIEKLRLEKVQENFFVMHMSNSTPTTFYEILKVTKKLGELKNQHQIWLNSSDSQIFFTILYNLKGLEENVEKIIIKKKPENEFCVLAHFVEDLLEEMASGNKIPKNESIEIAIGHFILVKEELCKEKSIEKDLKKYFGENLVNFGKAINIDFSPHNELLQIGREIIKKIEQMLQNDDWNYAYLNNSKMDEWNLLEYDLHKMGNDQKWEEIEQFRNEWKETYNKWVFNKETEKKPNFEQMMKNLIKILRNFIMPLNVREIVEQIEQMLQNEDWDYAFYLNHSKIDEWNFLQNDLHKLGNDQKWDEIEQLRGELKKVSRYSKEKNEEVMKNLIKILRDII